MSESIGDGGVNRPDRSRLGNASLAEPTLPVSARAVRTAAFWDLLAGEAQGTDDLARRTGLPAGDVAAALTLLSATGAVTVRDSAALAAHGLSLEPTRHRLGLWGREVWTWCAFDIIGSAAALGEDALELELSGGRPPPRNSIVGWVPRLETCTNVRAEFCPNANLFCSREYLAPGANRRVNRPAKPSSANISPRSLRPDAPI